MIGLRELAIWRGFACAPDGAAASRLCAQCTVPETAIDKGVTGCMVDLVDNITQAEKCLLQFEVKTNALRFVYRHLQSVAGESISTKIWCCAGAIFLTPERYAGGCALKASAN